MLTTHSINQSIDVRDLINNLSVILAILWFHVAQLSLQLSWAKHSDGSVDIVDFSNQIKIGSVMSVQ